MHENGGKRHEVPYRHNVEDYLAAYFDGCELSDDRKGPLFRTVAHVKRVQLEAETCDAWDAELLVTGS